MIKPGICTLTQLEKTKIKWFCLGFKKVSVTLYDEIMEHPCFDALAEHILCSFADERGAYKRTYHNRFEAFDTVALEFLNGLLDPKDSLSFQDMAISDGRTAQDFFEKLSTAFPNLHYTASDYDPRVFVIEQGKTKVTLSQSGKILEILYPPFVFNVVRLDNPLYYPLNHLLYKVIRSLVADPLVKKYQRGDISAKEILLFSPSVLRLAKKDSRFSLRQQDILKPFDQESHGIRAMNILNLSYFSQDEFCIILKNIYNGLKDQGLFITGSNQDAHTPVHGGLYQKHGKGFKKLFQSEQGSPIDSLILGFQATQS